MRRVASPMTGRTRLGSMVGSYVPVAEEERGKKICLRVTRTTVPTTEWGSTRGQKPEGLGSYYTGRSRQWMCSQVACEGQAFLVAMASPP